MCKGGGARRVKGASQEAGNRGILGVVPQAPARGEFQDQVWFRLTGSSGGA